MAKKSIPNYSNKNKTLEMAKYRMLQEKINRVLPQIYACFVLTLKEYYKWEDQDIVDCLSASGELWAQCADKSIDMISWCKESTGIDCKAMTTDKRVKLGGAERVEFEGDLKNGENPYQE